MLETAILETGDELTYRNCHMDNSHASGVLRRQHLTRNDPEYMVEGMPLPRTSARASGAVQLPHKRYKLLRILLEPAALLVVQTLQPAVKHMGSPTVLEGIVLTPRSNVILIGAMLASFTLIKA